jgi:hypothetical protein
MCQTEIDISVNDKVAVAMANKMASMAWVIMTRDVDYDPDLAAASVN